MAIGNDASVHFRELMKSTKDELKRMQPGPIGTTVRSGQQEAALWKKATALPEPEFQQFMDMASNRAGHMNDETQPCEACQFVMRHAGKGAARG